MVLLVAFVITLLVGDLACDRHRLDGRAILQSAGLFVFLALFLGIIPVAWKIAVRITEPRDAASQSR